MGNLLHQIIATKRKEIAARRAERPAVEFAARQRDQPPPRDFRAAVAGPPGSHIRLIAEIKRRSPSAGNLRPDLDPPALARIYADNNAAALSVLTDATYFGGSLADLTAARAAVPLPVLQKDFIVDVYQLDEARLAGADAVLLIVEALDDAELRELAAAAHSRNLTTLIEAHDADSIERALRIIDATNAARCLLGINNRDLRTQTVDLATFGRLVPAIRNRCPCVAESGIRTPDDVRSLQQAGACAVLIGETFLRAADVGAKVRELLARD